LQADRVDEEEGSQLMRSMLFVPGDRPDRFAKAVASGADAVIFDLEDAIVPDKRVEAREAVSDFLAAGSRSVPLWVRISPVGSEAALGDLAAVFRGRPDGIVLPKARNGEDVWRADHWLEALESSLGVAPGTTGLLPLITESAGAVLSAASFVSAPARVIGFTWGAEDLAADVGALANRTAEGHLGPVFEMARSCCLLTASAAGVASVDTIDPDIRDLEAVERRARDSRRNGFTAKLAIHPSQIAPIHAAFTPTEEEMRHAQRVLDAFAKSPGSGAVALDGKMLDKPHYRQAERVLSLYGDPKTRQETSR
jgi:citrate lyase subunit beta/citryl-CoA lyase